MPVSLSIKNVPDEVAARLRERAAKHHRSLQGELLSIIGEAAHEKPEMTIDDLSAFIDTLGLSTPDEATAMIRADRDAR